MLIALYCGCILHSLLYKVRSALLDYTEVNYLKNVFGCVVRKFRFATLDNIVCDLVFSRSNLAYLLLPLMLLSRSQKK